MSPEQINIFPIQDIANVLTTMAISFIAIDITAFVLAVTFLGEAIEIGKKEKVKFESDEVLRFDRKIIELKEKINLSTKPSDLMRLNRDIENFARQRQLSENNKNRIEKKYGSLRFIDSVVVPNILFFISIILSSVIIHLFTNFDHKLTIVISSAASLAAGIYGVAYSLNVVELVALGSEQRKTEKQFETLVKALFEHEKKNKPKPILKFISDFPFELKKGVEEDLKFQMSLDDSAGDYAEDVELRIFVSPEIELSGSSIDRKTKQSQTFSNIPNADTSVICIPSMNKKVKYNNTLKIKTDAQPGKYLLRYSMYCKGYYELPNQNPEFQINVK
jgi:hypothetical protein